jgi:hypothetical protein
MKILAKTKRDQNRAVLDPWTVVHFGVGLASGLTNAPLRLTLTLAVTYEILEQYLERRDIGQEVFDTRGPEVIPNAIVDVVAFAVAHQLGRYWNRTD